jgi:hypothetical protein
MNHYTVYTPEIAATICERLALGESMRGICLDPAMPARRTIHYWLTSNTAFRKDYEAARLVQQDVLAERVLEIASEPWPMVKKVVRGDGSVETTEYDAVSRSRLVMNALMWQVGRLELRKYGARDDPPALTDAPQEITRIERVIIDPQKTCVHCL